MDIMPSNDRPKTRQRSSNNLKEIGKCDFDVTERKKLRRLGGNLKGKGWYIDFYPEYGWQFRPPTRAIFNDFEAYSSSSAGS